KADDLSATARGDKKTAQEQKQNPSTPQENVISDLRGHVSLRDGVARFSNLSFKVPGADARLNGTYNLLTEAVDFHGTLKMDTKFSKAPAESNRYSRKSSVPSLLKSTARWSPW